MEAFMIQRILANTPMWVWALLLILIYLSWMQSRDRHASKNRAFTFPLIMIVLSLYGALSSSGDTEETLLFWCVGFVVATLLGVLIFPLRTARYDAQTKRYFFSGSWMPMLLILGIFIIKYGVGVLEGMQSPLLERPDIMNGLSLIYGLFSGIFMARTVGLLSLSSNKTALIER
jgi:hypothetical protein